MANTSGLRPTPDVVATSGASYNSHGGTSFLSLKKLRRLKHTCERQTEQLIFLQVGEYIVTGLILKRASRSSTMALLWTEHIYDFLLVIARTAPPQCRTEPAS